MEKIKKFKKFLKEENIDGYFIPKNDEFFGEYVSDHNDRLKYISNFSGSFGFALILKNKNYLFVDGRYILQANNQCGNFFKIENLSSKKFESIFKNKNFIIGYDPKIVTNKILSFFFNKKNFKLKPIENNLVDKVWKREIKKTRKKFYKLPIHSTGDNYRLKINKVVKEIKKKGADFQFITASENNAWLLNIRGQDTKYAPLPYCHILLEKNKKIKFFCDLKKINTSFKKNFYNIEFINIEMITKILCQIKKKKFVIDKNTCSAYFENIISKNNKILEFQDPVYKLKAVKNKSEIRNIKIAHIYDGIALTKYLFWLKKNYNRKKITELSASQKLFEFRKKNNKFKSLSFPTISGSGPNGAIIHYKATNKTNRVLKKGDVYLVDSGGQYEFGTTDVTRTISFNNFNQRLKNIFTRVLKGHIAVANYKIKNNTSGSKIDYVARKYLKQIGLDYSHGTGHGVGYFLNVHEGPQAISRKNEVKFKEGMVLSNEPGYYEKNKFGIRIENLIYVKKEKNRRYFKNLTMAPIERDLIDKSLLNNKEKEWLNKYHKEVFDNLKESMNKQEFAYLKSACSTI